jgi:hypothetical protein
MQACLQACRKTVMAKVVLALVSALLVGQAHAARPFFTDDARIVDKGHCQLETFTKSQRAYAGSEFWFMPACNPSIAPLESGTEITLGRNRIEDERNTIVQAKFLLKRLEDKGPGYAIAGGVFGEEPYVNGIASYALGVNATVLHANLGAIQHRDPSHQSGTWGIGLETRISSRWLGIMETFGQQGDTPTKHVGLRYSVIPDRFQLDGTLGQQSGATPARRFQSLGIRLLF